MKRLLIFLTAVLLILGLSACGSNNTNNETPVPAETATARPEETTAPEPENTETGNKTLVIYFSATGTTEDVAEKIAEITDGDLYEILAKEEYTSADLNWNDSSSRSTQEQNDKNCRPEIGSGEVSFDGYTTIYIGYPIWWGEEPRIMDTFVESHDFTGITVIPFCTSSSSGLGVSGKNLAKNAGTGNWLEGKRFGAGPSKEDLASWIDSLQ